MQQEEERGWLTGNDRRQWSGGAKEWKNTGKDQYALRKRRWSDTESEASGEIGVRGRKTRKREGENKLPDREQCLAPLPLAEGGTMKSPFRPSLEILSQ